MAIRSLARACARWSTCILFLLAVAAPASAQPTAVEFYHASWGHYFITVDPNEAAILDSGRIAGWQRTGETFVVDGSEGVCRFFTGQFAAKGSHFYTPYPSECDTLRGGTVWSFEGLVFRIDLPDARGACRAGTRPLYRLYNDGRSGAPNHRYTVRSAIVEQMRGQGWKLEGTGIDPVFACVPGAVASPPPPTSAVTGLRGSVRVAAGVRQLTPDWVAQIVSQSPSQFVFGLPPGLSQNEIFVVPRVGGFRVTGLADEGHTVSVTKVGIDELFDELEVEGTFELAVDGTTAADGKDGVASKAYLTPKPRFFAHVLDGQPGVRAEFKLEADCGGPKFEFVDAKAGFYGVPSVKMSKTNGTYELSGVRMVAEATLRLGCKLKDASPDSIWITVPIVVPMLAPLKAAGIGVELEFGGKIGWETDIAPVVQLATAKVDGTADIHRTPVFSGTLNGTALVPATILNDIAGTTGVSYTGKIQPRLTGKLNATALGTPVTGLILRTGPDVEFKAVFAAVRKLCGTVKWMTEVSAWRINLKHPFNDIESLLIRDERSIPTGWDLDCTTTLPPPPTTPPPPPPPPVALGPTGNWLFNRTSCEIAPGSAPTCVCPQQTLRIGMTEAPGGASIALEYPDFPGSGHAINRETTSRYQGCSDPIGGFVQCAVINFDLPDKRTAAMFGAAVSAACTINSSWQGAMQ